MKELFLDGIEWWATVLLYGAGWFSAPIRRWTLRRL